MTMELVVSSVSGDEVKKRVLGNLYFGILAPSGLNRQQGNPTKNSISGSHFILYP